MNTTGSLFLRLAGATRGPYSEAQLRDLADGGVISPDTESAPAHDGPWTPLKSLPLGAALFPKAPEFRFKAAEFDIANAPSAPPVDHRELIAAASRPPSAAVLESLRKLEPAPVATESNEVERLVREVARREARARPATLSSPQKASPVLKRLRTFVLIAAAGDAILAGIALSYGHLSDDLSLAIWTGWGLLFTFAVAILVFFLDSAD